MNGFVEPLPGLLDDPHLQTADLPALTGFHIAPLRNPTPSRNNNAPPPLEPLTGHGVPSRPNSKSTQAAAPNPDRKASTPKIKPSDVILARDAKKPSLAISELVESNTEVQTELVQLPAFVSLAVVERSPIRSSLSLEYEPVSKRPRLDLDSIGDRHLPPPAQKDELHTPRALPLLPAMVAGLHEPPSSAAMLPSMDLESFPKADGHITRKMDVMTMVERGSNKTHRKPPERMINSPEIQNVTLPPSASQESQVLSPTVAGEFPATYSTKDSKSSRRQPRKWTDQETEQLMAGVKRHGIGKWKEILQDPDLAFQNRSTVDLKDRFRVCSPKEYKNRATGRSNKTSHQRGVPSSSAATSTVGPSVAEKDGVDKSRRQDAPLRSPAAAQRQQTTAAEQGKDETSSKRKKRCPWTAEEDEALLKGLSKYGFQWTAIHDDSEIGLSHRRATDIRDRVRNKYPDGYRFAQTAPLRSEVAKFRDDAIKSLKSAMIKAQSAGAGPVPSAKAIVQESSQEQEQKDHVPKQVGHGPDPPPPPEPGGVTLPPILVDETGWNWDNTLPPLLDWEGEDMGI